MKVAVTGATGFIGETLVRKLLSEGAEVYGVGRDFGRLSDLRDCGNFIAIHADFSEFRRLPDMIDERDFDAFVHLAWKGVTRDGLNDTAIQIENVKASCDAAYAALKLRCHKICASGSIYQYAMDPAGNRLNANQYGIYKTCALDSIKAIAYSGKLSCSNMIFPNAYGPRDHLSSGLVTFVKKMLQDKDLRLIDGNSPDDWIYIDDLTRGMLHVITAPQSYSDYYIGHRVITTFREKMMEIKRILGSRSELRFGEIDESFTLDYGKIDLDALYNSTGFKAECSFRETIIATAEWLKCLD